ncbi:hypothetical protein PSFL107428_12580 [Pseudoalteromonas maricaloris]
MSLFKNPLLQFSTQGLYVVMKKRFFQALRHLTPVGLSLSLQLLLSPLNNIPIIITINCKQ